MRSPHHNDTRSVLADSHSFASFSPERDKRRVSREKSATRAAEVLNQVLTQSTSGPIDPSLVKRWSEELGNIGRESDLESFENGLLHFAMNCQRDGHDAQAAIVLQYLSTPETAEKTRKVAVQELQALNGRGPGRTEGLLRHFVSESISAKNIAPMLAGTIVGQMAKSWAVARLAGTASANIATRGMGAKVFSTAFGMAWEVPAFTVGERLLAPRGTSERSWGSDLAATALSLGAFKLSSYAGSKLPLSSLGSPLAGLVGLMAANRVQTHFGLRPQEDNDMGLIDSLASLAGMSIGASLGQRVLGPGWRQFHQDLEMRVPKSPRATFNFLTPFEANANRGASAARMVDPVKGTPKVDALMSMGDGWGDAARNRRKIVWEKLKANPEDRELGQVFADFLEEEGDPRAQLFNEPLDSKLSQEIQKNIVDSLMEKCGLLPRPDYEAFMGLPPLKNYEFSNGFLSDLTLYKPSAEALRKLWETTDGPFIRRVTLYAADSDYLRTLAESPGIKQLSHLVFDECNFWDDGFQALVNHPNISKLKSLSIYKCEFTLAMMEALAQSSHLTGLTELSLDHQLGDRIGMILGSSANFSELTVLKIRNEEYLPDVVEGMRWGVVELARSRHLSKLRELTLDHQYVENYGMEALATSRAFPALIHLSLEHNEIDDEGLIAFAASKKYRLLNSLSLDNNPITDAGALALSKSRNFPELVDVHLPNTFVTQDGARILLSSPRLPKLKNVEILTRSPEVDEEIEVDEPPSGGTPPLPMLVSAAPAILGLDHLLNGQPTALGLAMATVAFLPILVSMARKYQPWFRELALAPLWLMMGAGTPGGGSGGRPGRANWDIFGILNKLKPDLEHAFHGLDWLERKEQAADVAAGSHRGIGYDDHNEDRFFFAKRPGGSTVLAAIDGLGGHDDGEQAAAIVREVFRQGVEMNRPVPEILEYAHRVVRAYNLEERALHKERQDGHYNPGAVTTAVETKHLINDDHLANFWTVGDAEAVVLRRTPEDGSFRVVHHTTRPPVDRFERKQNGEVFSQTPDGRLALDDILEHRQIYFQPVDSYLGVNDRMVGFHQERLLKTDDVLLLGSDGFFSNFGSFETIGKIIAASGAKTAAEIHEALFHEALIRMSLLEVGLNQEITHDLYVSAYRMAIGREPPRDWKGMYEPHTEADGTRKSYRVFYRGVLDNATGKVVDVLKGDNLTLLVQVLGQKEIEKKEPKKDPAPLNWRTHRYVARLSNLLQTPMWAFLGSGGIGGGGSGSGNERGTEEQEANRAVDNMSSLPSAQRLDLVREWIMRSRETRIGYPKNRPLKQIIAQLPFVERHQLFSEIGKGIDDPDIQIRSRNRGLLLNLIYNDPENAHRFCERLNQWIQEPNLSPSEREEVENGVYLGALVGGVSAWRRILPIIAAGFISMESSHFYPAIPIGLKDQLELLLDAAKILADEEKNQLHEGTKAFISRYFSDLNRRTGGQHDLRKIDSIVQSLAERLPNVISEESDGNAGLLSVNEVFHKSDTAFDRLLETLDTVNNRNATDVAAGVIASLCRDFRIHDQTVRWVAKSLADAIRNDDFDTVQSGLGALSRDLTIQHKLARASCHYAMVFPHPFVRVRDYTINLAIALLDYLSRKSSAALTANAHPLLDDSDPAVRARAKRFFQEVDNIYSEERESALPALVAFPGIVAGISDLLHPVAGPLNPQQALNLTINPDDFMTSGLEVLAAGAISMGLTLAYRKIRKIREKRHDIETNDPNGSTPSTMRTHRYVARLSNLFLAPMWAFLGAGGTGGGPRSKAERRKEAESFLNREAELRPSRLAWGHLRSAEGTTKRQNKAIAELIDAIILLSTEQRLSTLSELFYFLDYPGKDTRDVGIRALNALVSHLDSDSLWAIAYKLGERLSRKDWNYRQSVCQAIRIIFDRLLKEDRRTLYEKMESMLNSSDLLEARAAIHALGLIYKQLEPTEREEIRKKLIEISKGIPKRLRLSRAAWDSLEDAFPDMELPNRIEFVEILEKTNFEGSQSNHNHAGLILNRLLEHFPLEYRTAFVLRARDRYLQSESMWNRVAENIFCLKPEQRGDQLREFAVRSRDPSVRRLGNTLSPNWIVERLEGKERLQLLSEIDAALDNPDIRVKSGNLCLLRDLIFMNSANSFYFRHHLKKWIQEPGLQREDLFYIERGLYMGALFGGISEIKNLLPLIGSGVLSTHSQYHFFDRFRKRSDEDLLELLLEAGKILADEEKADFYERTRIFICYLLRQPDRSKFEYDLAKIDSIVLAIAKKLPLATEAEREIIVALLSTQRVFHGANNAFDLMFDILSSPVSQESKEAAAEVMASLCLNTRFLDDKVLGESKRLGALIEGGDLHTASASLTVINRILTTRPQLTTAIQQFTKAFQHPDARARDYAINLAIPLLHSLSPESRQEIISSAFPLLSDSDPVVRARAKQFFQAVDHLFSEQSETALPALVAFPGIVTGISDLLHEIVGPLNGEQAPNFAINPDDFLSSGLEVLAAGAISVGLTLAYRKIRNMWEERQVRKNEASAENPQWKKMRQRAMLLKIARRTLKSRGGDEIDLRLYESLLDQFKPGDWRPSVPESKLPPNIKAKILAVDGLHEDFPWLRSDPAFKISVDVDKGTIARIDLRPTLGSEDETQKLKQELPKRLKRLRGLALWDARDKKET